MFREKTEEIWHSPKTETPYINRKVQKATWQDKNSTKTFDYTTIVDRLRTVSWSNISHPTGMVKPFTGSQPSHYPRKLCNQKDTHLKMCK